MIYTSFRNHDKYCFGGSNNETLDLFLCFSKDDYIHDDLKFPILPIGNLLKFIN